MKFGAGKVNAHQYDGARRSGLVFRECFNCETYLVGIWKEQKLRSVGIQKPLLKMAGTIILIMTHVHFRGNQYWVPLAKYIGARLAWLQLAIWPKLLSPFMLITMELLALNSTPLNSGKRGSVFMFIWLGMQMDHQLWTLQCHEPLTLLRSQTKSLD